MQGGNELLFLERCDTMPTGFLAQYQKLCPMQEQAQCLFMNALCIQKAHSPSVTSQMADARVAVGEGEEGMGVTAVEQISAAIIMFVQSAVRPMRWTMFRDENRDRLSNARV